MATDVDASQAIIDLLSNNWNSANTDSQTPTFSKIFEQPKNGLDFNASRDYVLIYNPTTQGGEIGIGDNTQEDVFESVTIDVRSLNRVQDSATKTDDSHIRKVRTEINRILKSNKVNFDSNFNELRSTQQWQEMNDRYRGIFRFVKNIELVQYCRDFS